MAPQSGSAHPTPAGASARELRIHGVGGDTPHAVLGLPDPADAIPAWTTRGGRVAVYARRARSNRNGTSELEASAAHPPPRLVFAWGDLTSGSRWFALWSLLLPFTLVNLAGWMPSATFRGKRLGLIRWMVFVGGVLLSMSTVGWLGLAAVLHLPVNSALPVALAALIVLVASATIVMDRHGRLEKEPASDEPDVAVGDRGPSLSDAHFFATHRSHRRRWWVHLAFIVIATAAVAGVALRGESSDAADDIGWMIVGVTSAQIVLVLTLGAICFTRGTEAKAVRWSGPALAVGAGVMVSGGVATGALVAAEGGIDQVPPNPVFTMLDAYGVAAVAALAVLLVVTGVVLTRPVQAETLPMGPPDQQLIQSTKARRQARLARLPRHLDLVASALVTAFAGAFAVVLVLRMDELDTYRPQRDALTWLALAFLGLFVTKLLRDATRNFMSREARRSVGVLWDVMSFWPRSYHPLAVRAYAERAVPELQQYLRTGGDHGLPGRWVITAHSQGSVIAYAALRSAGPLPVPVDLVTFGSPLASLFAKVFPGYFSVDDFAAQRAAAAPHGSWTNFLRVTDPVGREVFAASWMSRNPRVDVGIPDPNGLPPVYDIATPDAEQDPVVDTKVWGHNGYRRAQAFKAAVKEKLGRTA